MGQKIIDKRYQILEKLGSGTMGEVYKARDLNENNIKALKILSKHKTSSEAVQRFKREFSLLAGLHHPNLCAVHDFGLLNDGRGYFIMEYIEGRDIFTSAKGLSHEKLYPWVVQLCRVLEYIHAKGLIHYDIKPGNVLVQMTDNKIDNAVVKLMDFGLAGEQQIRSGALIKGTFPYIAPEMIKGLAIDHRADLYSLGILLYELFTRRKIRVSRRMSFTSLVKQRITWVSKPTYPSPLEADVGLPMALECIIFKLIAYEPAQRFSRANEVIKEINKISDCRFEIETEKTLEGYLLSSRFVGRDKELDLLKSLYERACQGEGKIVLVTGEVGIGKSRLLKEFKVFVQFQRRSCFMGFVHGDKTKSLEPFYELFRELLKYIDKKFSLKLSLAVLFKIFPDLAAGHLRRRLPKLIPLEPQAERLRTFEALSEFIRYMAAAMGGFVVLLEDLHWADDLSIQFLEYLGRNIKDRSVLICGTARREEVDKNPVLAKAIDNLMSEDFLVPIELRPLTYKSLYSFLESTITSDSNSAELARHLMDKTGGNPFFVEEIMRTWLCQGGLRIGRKVVFKDFKKAAIPETIEDLVLKRISDLDGNSKAVMKYGALLRKDFDFDLMKQLTELDDTTLASVLWKLKRRQILIEEGNRFRFYHPTLREVLNTQLGDRERQALNYQIGEALEFKNRDRIDKAVEDLAHYFIHAHHKKGVAYGLRAAKINRERYANEQAIKLYRDILPLIGDEDPRRLNILQKLAQMEVLIGSYDDATKHLHQAINLQTGTINKKIEFYLEIARIFEIKGKFSKALAIYQRAIKLLKKTEAGRMEDLFIADINVRKCRAYLEIGDYKRAGKYNFDALKPLKNQRGRIVTAVLCNLYNTMGNVESNKEEDGKVDYDKAVSYYQEAYRYAKKIKDEDRVAGVLINLCYCYSSRYEFKRMLACCKNSMRISEKIGNYYYVAANLFNISLLFMKKGDYAKALDGFQKSLAISEKIRNPFMTGVSFAGLGVCRLKLCDYKNAKKYFDESLKIFSAIDSGERKFSTISQIGEIYFATGNYNLALRFYRKALKICRDIRYQEGIALSIIDIGSFFIEIGEFSKAERYVKNALDIGIQMGIKEIEINCYIALCRINMMIKNYVIAMNYCTMGIRMAKKLELKNSLLQFFLLFLELNYLNEKYLKGLKIAEQAIKLALQIGTRDLYVQALLMKVKNGVAQGILSKVEVLKILEEAVKIAEEIGNPEIVWNVYFEYGRFFQNNRGNSKALEYYQKCNRIFRDIGRRIKNETYLKNYLGRADRQQVFRAIDEIIEINR